jgi:multidrug transporter EmrE-like cation transporter
MKILLMIVYLITASLGQVLYKFGANKCSSFEINGGNFNLSMNYISVIGIVLYALSFILFMIILPKFDVIYAIPILMGALYVMIITFSVIILKESASTLQYVGIGIILVGIIIMNIKR